MFLKGPALFCRRTKIPVRRWDYLGPSVQNGVENDKGRKKHINFFNISFWPPPKTPHFGPPEKSLCASFPGKERIKGTHINFFGGFSGFQKRVPNGLVSHYSAIGDTISCDAPYSAIGFKAKLFLRSPPCKAWLWIAIAIFMERSGGAAAIVCDTTENTVRQGYCYTCLVIGGGYFGRVAKPNGPFSATKSLVYSFFLPLNQKSLGPNDPCIGQTLSQVRRPFKAIQFGCWGSGARRPPQFLQTRSENAWANDNLSSGFPSIPGIAPGVAPRIAVSVLLKSRDAIPRMEFQIPRAAPRIPGRNSPKAPRMAFSLRERFS